MKTKKLGRKESSEVRNGALREDTTTSNQEEDKMIDLADVIKVKYDQKKKEEEERQEGLLQWIDQVLPPLYERVKKWTTKSSDEGFLEIVESETRLPGEIPGTEVLAPALVLKIVGRTSDQFTKTDRSRVVIVPEPAWGGAIVRMFEQSGDGESLSAGRHDGGWELRAEDENGTWVYERVYRPGEHPRWPEGRPKPQEFTEEAFVEFMKGVIR